MVDFAIAALGTDERSGLREELIDIVNDANPPQMFPEFLFTAADYEDGVMIEDHIGRARVFEVLMMRGYEHTVFGSNTHEPSQTWIVKIWYPAGNDWEIAATSDYQKIWQALVNDTSYPSGVEMRVALPLEAGNFQDTEEPNGFFLSVPIMVVLSVTS